MGGVGAAPVFAGTVSAVPEVEELMHETVRIQISSADAMNGMNEKGY